MQAKDAVAVAKSYISELFEAEQIRNLGLEEVDFDEETSNWLVTIGFYRPWGDRGALAGVLGMDKRDYKVVKISCMDGPHHARALPLCEQRGLLAVLYPAFSCSGYRRWP